MSDENDKGPIEDVRAGLGLLFRAARKAVERLPTKDLEQTLATGAKEVERAVRNVVDSIEDQFAHRPGGAEPPPSAQASDAASSTDAAAPAAPEATAPNDPPPSSEPKPDPNDKP
jgi:hypothetical protein